jgi:tRNA A37 threonylcarbamoyladenosine dehydratase
MTDFEERFGGIARLYGRAGLERLRRAHVAVIGIGGVGSWAAEALARSAVGALTLVDLDETCVSNVNRQLHALEGAIGRAKVEVMAERIRAINPLAAVRPIAEFFTEANAERLLAAGFDGVLDATDGVTHKARLIALCRAQGLRVVTCGAAGGRREATAVRAADLAAVTHDRLLAQVRKQLRSAYGFPREEKVFGVPAVYSPEPPVRPRDETGQCATAAASAPWGDDSRRLNCNAGLGSATFVTGTFGFVAAGLLVNHLAGGGADWPAPPIPPKSR